MPEEQLKQIETQLIHPNECNFTLGAYNIKSTNSMNLKNNNKLDNNTNKKKAISKKAVVRNKFLIDAIQTIQSNQN